MILYQGNHGSDTYGFPDGVAAHDRTEYGQVADPLGVYDKVWHVQVRPGDNNVQNSGAGERCEGLASILPACEPLYGKEGRTHFWAWDVVYGAGYAPNGSDWNNSGQWHNTGSTGATCAVVTPNSAMHLLVAPGKAGPDRHVLLDRIETGRRYEVAFRWDWSEDPAKGGVAAWLDGAPVLPRVAAQTLYEGQFTYPKLGNYRTAQGFVGDLYYHGYTAATTLAEAISGFTKSAHAAAWATAVGSPTPPPADTAKVLIGKAENELAHTTITYPDWKQRVDSGYYTGKKINPATGTGWGRAFAYLDAAKTVS